MLTLYRKVSPNAQLVYIHNHPVKYIAINAILLGAWIGYVEIMDRREIRKILENPDPQNDN